MKFSRPSLAGTGMIRTTLRLTVATVALGALAVLAGVATSARADSNGPIDFETSSGYTVGPINGQNGWSDTGGFDANVADLSNFSVSGFGGSQVLQISDAVTSGSFGDQTFAPQLSAAAGEATPRKYFSASFQIGTALAAEQPGLHMSVSPDNGSGARMSYLRFEDQSDGVHVFFDDATDAGPYYTQANFSDTQIAILSHATAHTIGFSMHLVPGPANDVVYITIDGVLKATGTSWEDYYRYDNEQQGSGIDPPPTTSTLLFKEGGAAHLDHAGHGFLVDNVSYASSTAAACVPTGFMRDGIDMTAAQIGGNVTGTLDASGCNIGVYYDNIHTGNVNGATIFGANYYGVVVNGDVGVVAGNVKNSNIHDIGESPLNGSQHGNAIYYRALGTGSATGIVSGNTITDYQKGGITVSGKVSATITNNHVTGQGPVNYIAQNGIQMGYGAKGSVTGNTVIGNAYTGAGLTSSAGILVVGGPCFGLPYTTGLTISKNTLRNNDVGVWLFNAALDNSNCVAGTTKTNNTVKLNTITNSSVTNTTGHSATCGYQVGVADVGHRDSIVNNMISGVGYTPQAGGDCNSTAAVPAFLRHVDLDSSARAKPSNK
jgi:hypothetical protein